MSVYTMARQLLRILALKEYGDGGIYQRYSIDFIFV